ncbi:MAG TPA: MaoC family dehydratase N-terminal domain-containing protein [candidate division Zixibacteria bacterium]|nr:MaoC family dehydratase N-terminal domain-containing protein [candidate division Zixibacteria bacterium]
MTEPLEAFKRYIGKSETAADVVTASAMSKIAAALDVEEPPLEKGAPIPPGWYGAFFPALHRRSRMRPDGQAAGGGIVPPIPLPRRRLGGTRATFHAPLRIGDEITRVTEIADIRIDENEDGAAVTVVERNRISNGLGLAVVEERDLVFLSESRAEKSPPLAVEIPGRPAWTRTVEPDPVLLFRFSAIRFNSHRIHYDRGYTTGTEKLPGLVVQGTLVSQLLIEMCRAELPGREMRSFAYRSVRQIYDTGNFTIAGLPREGGREAVLWAVDPEGRPAMTATATFA